MLHGDGTPISLPKCYHIPTGESMSREKFRAFHKMPENGKITAAYTEQFFRRDFNLHKDSATYLL